MVEGEAGGFDDGFDVVEGLANLCGNIGRQAAVLAAWALAGDIKIAVCENSGELRPFVEAGLLFGDTALICAVAVVALSKTNNATSGFMRLFLCERRSRVRGVFGRRSFLRLLESSWRRVLCG